MMSYVDMEVVSIICISMIIKTALVMTSCLLFVACSEQQSEDVLEDTAPVEYLKQDPARYTHGLSLFQRYCAACHGKQAEGAPGWPAKDANGQFQPPPLTDKGRTWHHPMHNLVDIISDGTVELGGGMPAWKKYLSRKDIDDILFWIQSQWSREKYAHWYKLNREVEQNRKEYEEFNKSRVGVAPRRD